MPYLCLLINGSLVVSLNRASEVICESLQPTYAFRQSEFQLCGNSVALFTFQLSANVQCAAK